MNLLTAWLVAQVVIAVLGGAALLASRLVRRDDVELWHAVWTAIVAASVAAPFVGVLMPGWMVPVPDALIAWSRPVMAATDANAKSGLWPVLLAVLVAGSAVLGVRLVAGVLLLRRLVARSEPVEGVWLARLSAAAPMAAAMCRVHHRVRVPMTVGLRRPLILLPDDWMRWESSRLSAVLRHELAHVARRDFAWNTAAAVAQVLHWPNPVLWMVSRRLRLTAELACDRQAAERVGADAYAAALVATARELARLGGRANLLAPGAAMKLEARIQALLERAPDAPALGPRPRLAIALCIAAALLAVMAARPNPATSVSDPTAGAGHTQSHAAAHAGLHRNPR